MGAETALLAHQAQVRAKESKIRKEARIDLARRGLVPTETEIAKWKAEKERERVSQHHLHHQTRFQIQIPSSCLI